VPLGTPAQAAAEAAALEAAAEEGEEVQAEKPYAGRCLLMLTRNGGIKKTPLTPSLFKLSKAGSALIKVEEGDAVGWAATCSPGDCVLVATSTGRVLLFPTDTLRAAGRGAGPIKGIKLGAGQEVVGMTLVPRALVPSLAADPGASEGEEEAGEQVDAGSGPWVLMVTAEGKGKRVPLSVFSVQRRGNAGVYGTRPKDGDSLAVVRMVRPGEEVVLGTARGKVSRLALESVPVYSKSAVGNKLISISPGDVVQAVAVVPSRDKGEGAASDSETEAAVEQGDGAADAGSGGVDWDAMMKA